MEGVIKGERCCEGCFGEERFWGGVIGRVMGEGRCCGECRRGKMLGSRGIGEGKYNREFVGEKRCWEDVLMGMVIGEERCCACEEYMGDERSCGEGACDSGGNVDEKEVALGLHRW